jgi:hypothetical protein
MPLSIYTLFSGFVSSLLVQNFTFYDEAKLSAVTHFQFENILFTLGMSLERVLDQRFGKNSPAPQHHPFVDQPWGKMAWERAENGRW